MAVQPVRSSRNFESNGTNLWRLRWCRCWFRSNRQVGRARLNRLSPSVKTGRCVTNANEVAEVAGGVVAKHVVEACIQVQLPMTKAMSERVPVAELAKSMKGCPTLRQPSRLLIQASVALVIGQSLVDGVPPVDGVEAGVLGVAATGAGLGVAALEPPPPQAESPPTTTRPWQTKLLRSRHSMRMFLHDFPCEYACPWPWRPGPNVRISVCTNECTNGTVRGWLQVSSSSLGGEAAAQASCRADPGGSCAHLWTVPDLHESHRNGPGEPNADHDLRDRHQPESPRGFTFETDTVAKPSKPAHVVGLIRPFIAHLDVPALAWAASSIWVAPPGLQDRAWVCRRLALLAAALSRSSNAIITCQTSAPSAQVRTWRMGVRVSTRSSPS